MDRFRTVVDIPASPEKIGYQTHCLFMGSCFTEEIGQRMKRLKFPVLVNPFGTLFNPASIGMNLRTLLKGDTFTPEDLNHHHGMWFSFSYYTAFARRDRKECLDNINRSLEDAAAWLRQTRCLVITFGTAWVYIYNANGKLVANCHKLPASEFTRKLLAPAEITAYWNDLLVSLRQVNPDMRVIFTVSPVRHWKDGAVGNQLSKSILHLSIHDLLKGHKNAGYFPAYEIFMDELRDYRFYDTDMLHPSAQGSDYVWERFCDAYLDGETKKIMAGVTTVLKAVDHRPRQTDSPNHRTFIANTLNLIGQISSAHPYLDFAPEIARLRDKA